MSCKPCDTIKAIEEFYMSVYTYETPCGAAPETTKQLLLMYVNLIHIEIEPDTSAI